MIKDGKAQYRPVEVGEQVGENWTILQGLQSGEQIVVDGVQTLSAGAEVEVTRRLNQQPADTPASPAAPDAMATGTAATVSEGQTDTAPDTTAHRDTTDDATRK